MEKPLLPGLHELTSQPLPTAPSISPEYESAISKLVLMQREGVTHFYGSELDLGPNRNIGKSIADRRGISLVELILIALAKEAKDPGLSNLVKEELEIRRPKGRPPKN